MSEPKLPQNIYMRDGEIEGIKRWFWIQGDEGTWNGPANEFTPLREAAFKYLPEDRRRVMVQAGGAMGMYPKLWSKHFEKVFTFEPARKSFYVLTLNCEGCDNIYKFNAALHCKSEMLAMESRNHGNYGMNRIEIKPDSDNESIFGISLDDFNLQVCDLIQLDVEGWEVNALLGSMETIERCLPVITVETYTTQVQSLLRPLGYKEGTRPTAGPDHVLYSEKMIESR